MGIVVTYYEFSLPIKVEVGGLLRCGLTDSPAVGGQDHEVRLPLWAGVSGVGCRRSRFGCGAEAFVSNGVSGLR